MKKKNLIIALGVTTAALAALVPYKVKKEENEAEDGKTVVKLKALSYALDVSVEKEKGVDVVLKVPGITNVSLVNVEKHVDLPKDEEPEEDDNGEELVTEEEFDIAEEDAEVEEDIADAAEDIAEEAVED